MGYDLIIKGGLIVDGSGSPAYGGDVAIQDRRIAAVGQVDGSARRTIDANGLVVSPGFVDVHTHYDAQLAWDPQATPSSYHGVTTVVMGNCGYTLAPCKPSDRDYLTGLFSSTEQVPKGTLLAGVPFEWESYGDYLGWLQRRGLGVNVVSQIGHSAVRRFVMGEAALERTATEAEVASMVELVEEAFEAGAMGFSTSQVPHQVGEMGEHIPAYFASDQEVEALAAVIKRRGRGMVCINPRTKAMGFDEKDQAFLVKLSQVAGAMVSWNDFTQREGEGERWREVLEYMEREIQRGNPVRAVARCQPTDLRFSLRTQFVRFVKLDAWREFFPLSDDGKLQALAEPSFRQRLVGSLDGHSSFHLAGVVQGATPATQGLAGRLLTEIASERGVKPAEAMLDIALEDRLGTQFALFAVMGGDQDAVERILKSPATVVGISDGGAHLQTFSTSDYTTYFLKHWVRERGTFTLEEGVRALTSRPARLFGITDRGLLEPGQAADVVIFDRDSVGPLPVETLHDLPGEGSRLVKQAQGVPWVLVNGEPLVEKGPVTGATPGRVLGFQGS